MADKTIQLGHAYEKYLTDLDAKDLPVGTSLTQKMEDLLSILVGFEEGKQRLAPDEALVCFDEALAILENSYDEWRETNENHKLVKMMDNYFALTTNIVDDFFVDESENDHAWFTHRYESLTKIEAAIASQGVDRWAAFLKLVVEMMHTIQRDKQSEIQQGLSQIHAFVQ